MHLSDADKEKAIQSLIANSSPRQDFFLMMSLSIVMATFGLLINSGAIIIGSMLIAPLLYPLLSLSLGIVITDPKLILRSIYTIIKASAIAVVIAAIVTLLFTPNYKPTVEIIARTHPTLEYLLIAIVAGLAASFSLIKPELNERFAGVAISVALIPPLAVNGIGIAWVNWEVLRQSLLLYIINVIGVVFSSLVVFSLMNLHRQRKVTQKAVKKEEQIIKKEQESIDETT